MSGSLDISSGGIVSVDTVSLDVAALGFDAAATDLEAIAEDLLRVSADLTAVAAGGFESREIDALATDATERAAEARAIAADLRRASDVYEIVELRARLAAAETSGDAVAVTAARDALADASAFAPDAARDADALWAAWRMETMAGLALPLLPVALLLGPVTQLTAGMGLLGLGSLVAGRGWNRVDRGERLTGAAPAVRTRLVAPAEPTAPPATLAAAASRIPTAADARIRVERYTMPDGGRQFAVYLPGTRTTGFGGPEPFDMRSNVRLYTGSTAAAYEAARQALQGAGARPGDVVHAFGHSQGAMVASRLAIEGGFDTRTLVTFGSPVAADVGPDTLSVSLRHMDDPVVALADGGMPGGAGAPGGLVVERAIDPVPKLDDLSLSAHHMETYIETAAMVDASSDPRVGAVQEVFAQLGAAASVESTVWGARRLAGTAGVGGVSVGSGGAG